jgi:hypothetical protein
MRFEKYEEPSGYKFADRCQSNPWKTNYTDNEKLEGSPF